MSETIVKPYLLNSLEFSHSSTENKKTLVCRMDCSKFGALRIPGFTGIDQAYEHPAAPEIELSAGDKTLDECVQQVIQLLQEKVIHQPVILQALQIYLQRIIFN